MTKAGKHWILAIAMALLGLAEAVSGFVLWLAFPTDGGGGAGNLTFWELTKHTWIDIHDWVAVALVILVIMHIILHWKWIVRMVKVVFQGQAKKVAPVLIEND